MVVAMLTIFAVATAVTAFGSMWIKEGVRPHLSQSWQIPPNLVVRLLLRQ